MAIAECKEASQAYPDFVTHGELWVQFHNLLFEALSDEGVLLLASSVGSPRSEIREGFVNGKRFLKLRLSINLCEQLKDRVLMKHPMEGDRLVYLVYEKLTRVCSFCGLVGHKH